MNNPNAIDPKYSDNKEHVAIDSEKLIKLIEMIDNDEASTGYRLDGKSFSAFELEKELAIIGALYLFSNIDLKHALKTKDMLKEAFDHEFNS